VLTPEQERELAAGRDASEYFAAAVGHGEDVWGHLDEDHTRPGAPLFPSERRNSDGSARRVGDDALRAGLAAAALPTWSDKLTPHVLRHFAASQLYLSGMDLISVQELLGHSWIATTMRYVDSRELHRSVAMVTVARPGVAGGGADGAVVGLGHAHGGVGVGVHSCTARPSIAVAPRLACANASSADDRVKNRITSSAVISGNPAAEPAPARRTHPGSVPDPPPVNAITPDERVSLAPPPPRPAAEPPGGFAADGPCTPGGPRVQAN